MFTDFMMGMIDDIAETANTTRVEVFEDFIKFSEEIDRVIKEEGLSESEATEKVVSYWNPAYLMEV